MTAAAEVVARREGLGWERVRRWVIQAQIDGGQRQGATSEEMAEIKESKAMVHRLEEDKRGTQSRNPIAAAEDRGRSRTSSTTDPDMSSETAHPPTSSPRC